MAVQVFMSKKGEQLPMMNPKGKGVQVFFSTKGEKIMCNPLAGSVTMLVGLEDPYGVKYSADKVVAPIVSKYFAGANMAVTRGLWKSKTERSMNLKILNDPDELSWEEFKSKSFALKEELQKKLRQEKIYTSFKDPSEEYYE